MGFARREITGVSELLLHPTDVKVIASIPAGVCEGQMTFIKRTTGDIVYISVKSKTPTATQYDIILTDTFPMFTEEGIVPGDVRAIGTLVTTKVSAYCSFSMRE